jgi:oxygen-independent coproporphyrinogen-3 oxidase
VTLEANPGTVERARLTGFRRAGVNRLSFGIQSFQPALLTTLGRVHDAEDARAAIRAARAAGFGNLNLDLIFAVPGQDRAMWRTDLAEALAYEPEHLSTYGLTYEPSTPFHTLRARGTLTPLDEDDELWMYEHTRATLAAAGYEHYEISNFARPGRTARHNRAYWQGVDYLGLGAGAHSYAHLPGWGRRWSNERIPDRYVAAVTRGDAAVSAETLAFDTAAAEFMFLGLRELAGVDPARFRARYGRALEDVHPDIADLETRGLLARRDGRLALTARGLLLADSVFAAFMPPA